MAQPLYGSTSYAPTMPGSQGSQGQQGANNKSTPDITGQKYRASTWRPAPASSTTAQGQAPQQGQQGQMSGGGQGGNTGSPVMSNGLISQPSQPQMQPQLNIAPPLQAAPQQQPQQTPVSPAHSMGQYGIPGDMAGMQQFFSQLQPGTAVAGQQGATWQYVPQQGWVIQQGGQQGAQPPAQGPQPGQPGAQPNPAQYSPYGPYPGRPDGTVYQPGQLPQYQFQDYNTAQFNQQAPAPYQPGQVNQFQAPDQSGIGNQYQQLMSNVLQNPGWGSQAVAQMKEAQKQQTLDMQKQMLAQNAQQSAGRGFGFEGQAEGQAQRIQDAAMQEILGGQRDIDMQNAQNSFANQLSALGAAEQFQTGQANRSTQFYNTGLQGQMAQQQLNQAGADSQFRNAQFGADQQQRQADENYRSWNSQFQPAEFGMQAALAQQGLNRQGAQDKLSAYGMDLDAFNAYKQQQQQGRQLDIQQQLGQGGLGIDQQRLQQQGGQFDRQLQLNWAQMMNDMMMGRSNLGFNYAQLQNQAQSQMMQSLFPNGVGQ